MAILRSGILGRASGKVAGVVGGHWKDKSYVREYVIPANPDTTLQQAQRGKMRRIVAFLKPLVGQIAKVYVDKFQKSMSGFNAMVSANIAVALSPITYAAIRLTQGPLWVSTPIAAVYSVNLVAIGWVAASLGNNGAATDKAYAVVFDSITGLWHFAAAEVLRSVGTITVDVPAGATAANFAAYLIFAKYSLTSPTLLEMVSNSKHYTVS